MLTERQGHGIYKTAKALASLLMVALVLYVFSVNVYALAKELKITGKDTPVSESFHVVNMFPGDEYSEEYVITMKYKNTAALHFSTEIVKDSVLSEVLMMKIETNGLVMYDGLIASVPDNVLDFNAPNTATVNVDYKITVYLDTSVGNEYQKQEVICNFVWWAEGEDIDNAQTGDNIAIWIVTFSLAIVAAVVFIVIWRKLLNDRTKSKA